MDELEQLFNELFKTNGEVDKWVKEWRKYTDPCIGNPAEIQRFPINDEKMLTVWDKYQDALAIQSLVWDKIREIKARLQAD